MTLTIGLRSSDTTSTGHDVALSFRRGRRTHYDNAGEQKGEVTLREHVADNLHDHSGVTSFTANIGVAESLRSAVKSPRVFCICLCVFGPPVKEASLVYS